MDIFGMLFGLSEYKFVQIGNIFMFTMNTT